MSYKPNEGYFQSLLDYGTVIFYVVGNTLEMSGFVRVESNKLPSFLQKETPAQAWESISVLTECYGPNSKSHGPVEEWKNGEKMSDDSLQEWYAFWHKIREVLYAEKEREGFVVIDTTTWFQFDTVVIRFDVEK